jgi:hypothetical protein
MSFCTVCGRPRSGPVRFCTACGAPFPEAVSTETLVAEPPVIAPHLPVTSDHPDTVAAYYPPGSGQAAPEQLGTPAGQQPVGHAAEDDPFGDIFASHSGEGGAPPNRPGHAGDYQAYQGADPRNLPPPPPRGRGKAVLAVLAAIAVLAAGGGAAFWLTHRHQAHGTLAAPTTAASAAPQSPAASTGPATPSGAATTSASPGTGSEQAEVTQITPEIQQSASARKTVLKATGAVGQCTMAPSTGVSLMNQAISQRQAALGRMGSLSVNAIPNGPAMLTDLRQVLQHSITADHDFIGWMQDIQNTGTCSVNTSTDASFQAAGRADTLAVKAKKKFLGLWNPIARKFGQPTFTSAEI